jgi:hypothetical protein
VAQTYQPTTKPDGSPYKGDPFTVVNDGGITYIGNDGFVIPKNIQELQEREPNYIRSWVIKKLQQQMILTPENVEDWTQELYLHLANLPEDSVGRKPGYNEANPNGCTDLIQCFNPYSAFGASIRRFFFYVNRCLANKFESIHRFNQRNPLQRWGNFSFDPSMTFVPGDAQKRVGADEFVHANSFDHRESLQQIEAHRDNKIFVQRVREFVQEHQPDLIPFMDAIGSENGMTEVMEAMNIDPATYSRRRKRLKVLVDCLTYGQRVPEWRGYNRIIKPHTPPPLPEGFDQPRKKGGRRADPLKRQEQRRAMKAGVVSYDSVVRCRKGHLGKRYANSAACVACVDRNNIIARNRRY